MPETPKKKILVISYYWPPSGGGGVQRWLKFVKYLPENGWEPIVFTPENPEFDLKDDSLIKDIDSNLEVLRFPIWEPFSFYKKFFNKGGKQKLKQGIVIEKSKLSLVDRIVIWVRANMFIPDPRRFWIKPSVKFLVSYVQQHNIDVIVTTGPPHSMHLIGLGIKKKCNVKWLADFRDPWSDWDILDKLNVSSIVRGIHRKMEMSVLNKADLVLTVSNRLADELKNKGGNAPVAVITNGVDPTDFELSKSTSNSKKFRIAHMGLLNEVRNPTALWEVLEELCDEVAEFKSDLEIVLAGMVSGSILDRLNGSNDLSNCFKHLDYISHQEVFDYYKSSSVLLLLLNQTTNSKWILPGKLFEYLLAKKSILTLGEPESDVKDVLDHTKAGDVFLFSDKSKIKDMICNQYDRFKSGNEENDIINTSQYERNSLTKELSQLLIDMI
jgi:glycosyltransferase involved in cell wall biosynthesis